MKRYGQPGPLARYGAGALCRVDEHVLAAVRREDVPGAAMRGVCATILAGTWVYGFAFGVWRAPLQGLYSALKMPVLFFATAFASASINTMLAHVLGARLSFRQVLAGMLLAMGICAAIMGALAPIVLFFALQVAAPDPALVGLPFDSPAVAAARRAYWLLLLSHIAVIGLAGLAGNIRLYGLLKGLTTSRRLAACLMAIWLAVAGFVGCELSWLLSPFLCKPTQAPHIVPREYFQENFYERVWRAMRDVICR